MLAPSSPPKPPPFQGWVWLRAALQRQTAAQVTPFVPLSLPGRHLAEPAPLAADQGALPVPLVQPLSSAAAAAGKGRHVAPAAWARLGGRRQQQPGLPQPSLRAGAACGPPGKPPRDSQPRQGASGGERLLTFSRQVPQGRSGPAGDAPLAPLLRKDFSPCGCALVREATGPRNRSPSRRTKGVNTHRGGGFLRRTPAQNNIKSAAFNLGRSPGSELGGGNLR